jgi:replicative DNA helicase
MKKLNEKGLHIDVITISDELERAGQLAEFCMPGSKLHFGVVALSQLRDVRTTDSAEGYSLIVHDYAAKRYIDNVIGIAHQHANNGRNAADIVSDIETELGKLVIHNGKSRQHTVNMEVATARAIEATLSAGRGERAVNTGLPDLDNLLAPQKTDLIIVAGRPGLGKSALLATIAIHSAKSGQVVKYFTAEMGATQVAQRFISQLSGVSAFRIMKGTLVADEWDKVNLAVAQLQDMQMTICDLPEIKIGQIRTECRKSPVDVVLLDYIQLANSDSRNDRRDLDIGEVTRGCKGLAKELDIPFFAAAQIGRSAEQRKDGKPTLADLRESGSIENDADSVVFIYRTDVLTELIIGKHRNGPVGTVPVYFDEATIAFKSNAYELPERTHYPD